MRDINRTCRGSTTGYALLEVLIAVLVLSIGVLGVAAGQMVALRNSQSALQRTVAVSAARSMLEAARANHQEALAGAYARPWFCVPSASSGSLAASDLNQWITDLQTTLRTERPACGQVTCTGQECTVHVRWDDSRADAGRLEEEVSLSGPI